MAIIVRKMTAIDVDGVNDLYESITGIKRTFNEYKWQWMDAPAGKSDAWVIVDTTKNKIVGHHGLMGYYFSYNNSELLVAKTENTMVDKSYRRRIIYPLIELRLLKSYSEKYDLIFSSMGPEEAMRMRVGLGYNASHKWLRDDIVIKSSFYTKNIKKKFCKSLSSANVSNKRFIKTVFLTNYFNSLSGYVDDIWDVFKKEVKITVRRKWCDFKWRIIDNPYFSGYILVGDYQDFKGYAVLNFKSEGIYQLEDIVVYPFNQEFLDQFFKKIMKSLNKFDVEMLVIQTSSDSLYLSNLKVRIDKRMLSIPWVFYKKLQRINKILEKFMPRKCGVSYKKSKGILDDWYVTPFIFEGRE